MVRGAVRDPHEHAGRGDAAASASTACSRCRSRAPVEEQVAALNRFQPQFLNAYPSAAMRLAEEQEAGRLRLSLTVDVDEQRAAHAGDDRAHRRRVRRRRRSTSTRPPRACSATSASATTASTCSTTPRVVENVDEDGRAVPPGTPGARVLVTNLHNLVQPIIRLAVADVVTHAPRALPVRALARRGRRRSTVASDDVLSLPARGGGTVTVLPAQFSVVTRDRGVREFQVRQEPGGVRVLVVPCGDGDPGLEARLRGAVAQALDELGRRRAGRGRAPRRTGAPGREAQIVRAAARAKLCARERRGANGGGRARRGRARGVARPRPRPRRARQGARRRARGAPRPAADVLRGAAQPAQGARRQAADGRAGRARAAQPLGHDAPDRPPRARGHGRPLHLRQGRPRLLRRAHRRRAARPSTRPARRTSRWSARGFLRHFSADELRGLGRLWASRAPRLVSRGARLRHPPPRRRVARPHRHAAARPRRGPHARLRPAGHQGRGQDARGLRGRRARLRHGARQHVPPVPHARPRADPASSAGCTASCAGTAR